MKISTAFILLGCLLAPQVALATEADEARQYATCMKLTRSQPEEAFEMALAWRDNDGGDPARHCSAVALIASSSTKKGLSVW